ncbi:MAG: efflux RND transporter permease subunit [Bdellovibrionaceae bacterium]|nr:efflux RND transporter permease subunit [Pseudobdellovibrionaceae bacterium]
MRGLIDLSLARPVFAWILMFAMIVFGAIGLSRMGISQMPDVNFPVLNISINYEGAAPEVIEAEIIDMVEERLLAIEGIKEMRSTASQGSARVTLEFDINRNVDVALQEVQSALSQLRLPPGVDPAIIRKQNPEEDPILFISIYSNDSLKNMLTWTDSFLLDQLRFLPGIGEVSIGGFSERNLRIWLKPEQLTARYLTILDVVEALRSQHIETAAGQFAQDKRELRVRWMGEASEVDQVKNIQILRRGGQMIQDQVIRISDVAEVEDGLSDIRRMARFDGREAIAIAIRKQRGTNEVDISKAVQERLNSLQDRFPKGYGYRINVDFTRPTEATVNLTLEKLLTAAVITILICFLFLGSFQAAINILFSIPTSIVGTFIILYFSGFTLNLFTLLALTLAVSIVVDDAIMLLENIVRHYRMGKSPVQAAGDGAKEILPAATAATLAVVAVFLPVIFMEGVIGKFFFQFGVTLSAAVLLSLLEAVTITPMRAAAFLSTSPKTSRFETWLDEKFHAIADSYRKILAVTLRWKVSIVVVSLALFAVSLLLLRAVRQEFVPAQDQDILIVMGQAPPGSSLEFTEKVSYEIEAILKKMPEVEGFVVTIGAGGPNSQVNQIFMPVALKPKSERATTHTDLMNRLRGEFKKLKGIRVTMRDISARNLSAGRSQPVAISLRGPDLVVLNDKAEELMKRLGDEGLAVDLDTDYRVGIPELVITPNRRELSERNVTIESVGQTIAAAVGGQRQGRYTSSGQRYDIRFKVPDSMIRSAADIQRLYVRNAVGNLVPLSVLTEAKEQPASQSINRVNRQRAVSVNGNLAPGQSQAKVLARAQEIAKEILPTGYSAALEGGAAGFAEAFSSLYSALMIGILIAYMILAVQFNSFIHPIPVLIALPFSVSGAFLALWAWGASLNLFSFIGLIVLMGIAKKNSILLVEFTNHIREKGKTDPAQALLEACPVRLRPIVMTSIATIAAAVPLVTGSALGAEARLPMGLAIIGGTIVSTLLTLIVVPALYLMLTRLESSRRKTAE